MIMEKKSREILVGASLSIASLVVFLAILEIILRLAGYNPIGQLVNDPERSLFIRPSTNPDRVYEATPGASGRGWGTDISINSHGFRGREYVIDKPDGVFRIVVIGDSIAFGNGLDAGEAFPTVLENKYRSAGKNVEVLNLALGGYDTLQEIATLEEIGLSFKPDLVVLAYCINDIGIASGNAHYIEGLKKYRSVIYKLRTAQFLQIQLDRVSMIRYTGQANSSEEFSRTYQNRLADISSDIGLEQKRLHLQTALANSNSQTPFTHDYTDTLRLQRLRYALQKLQTLQDEHKFKTMAMLIPYLIEDKESSPIYQAVYDIIEYEFGQHHFPLLDLYPVFSTAGLSTLINRNNDGVHPNATGHRIIAETLYKTISTD